MDYGHEQTDRELKKLEKRITEEYEKAYKEVKQKADDYFKQFQKKDADKKKLVDAGLMSKKDYLAWRQSAMLTNKRWNDMADVLAKDLVNADKIAMSMLGEQLPDVYALNANYGTYEIEHGMGIDTSWTMYDHSTVENLMRENPQIIPKPKMDIPKDMRWNRQKIHSAITQGVLQGDSIPDIAKRLRRVTDMDRTAAIRNARTYTTAAENKGRIDSYQWAKELGIELQKEWMATPDGRTRDSHVDLDGERVEVDGTFSNGCRYPADPMGDPAEVYNCRCTLVAAVKGRQYHDDRFTRLPEGMTYEDWKAHKLREGNEDGNIGGHVMVNGEDISATWVRRENKFAFEIEDVINAQGFDGLPRVVSADEFDRYVDESNFIAQRTYSAPDQETLDAYRDQLYNGKWYVDCSVGHSSFGQGMYCTPEFATQMGERGSQEQKLYGDLSRSRIEQNAKNQYLFDKYEPTLNNVIKENNITDSSIMDVLKAYDPVQGSYHDNEWYVTKNVDWVKEFASSNPEKYKIAKAIIDNNEDKLEKAYRVAMKESKSYTPPKAISNTETFTLTPNAKIADYSKLAKEMTGTGYTDIGVFATVKGYDAVNIDILDGTIEANQAIILNRTKVIFKGE